MAAPLKASKNFLAQRPNEHLASRIKVGGVESAHDYIFSAAITQLSAKAILDDLKRHGHHFSLERVLDIIRVHHPNEEHNTLYEGDMFAARFILEVDRNWNLSAAGVAEKASIRGVGGGSTITARVVFRIRKLNEQAIATLTRGDREKEGWKDAVLCLFILGYSPEEINSICQAFSPNSYPPTNDNLIQIQNIIIEAHPHPHKGDEQLTWLPAAHILDIEAKSYILHAFLFNMPIHEITENLHIHGYNLWQISDNLVGGYLAEQGCCERLYDPWLDEIMQGGAPATEDEIRQDPLFVADFLEEKDRLPNDDSNGDDDNGSDEKDAADAVSRVARLGSWRL